MKKKIIEKSKPKERYVSPELLKKMISKDDRETFTMKAKELEEVSNRYNFDNNLIELEEYFWKVCSPVKKDTAIIYTHLSAVFDSLKEGKNEECPKVKVNYWLEFREVNESRGMPIYDGYVELVFKGGYPPYPLKDDYMLDQMILPKQRQDLKRLIEKYGSSKNDLTEKTIEFFSNLEKSKPINRNCLIWIHTEHYLRIPINVSYGSDSEEVEIEYNIKFKRIDEETGIIHYEGEINACLPGEWF
jgi:hypothetical protein